MFRSAVLDICCDMEATVRQVLSCSPGSNGSSPPSSSISESEGASQLSRPSSSSSLSGQNVIRTPPISVIRKLSANESLSKKYANIGAHSLRCRSSAVTDAMSDDDTTTSGSSAGNSASDSGTEQPVMRRFSMDQLVGRRIRLKANLSTCNKERKTCSMVMTPSPSISGRSSPIYYVSRSRLASIRRESDCSIENEMAHEKLVQTGQLVSSSFDDITIGDSADRDHANSLSEPITVFTNAFFPHSCSPSPTRPVDSQKQCYSPSTGQVVRNNMQYSPSPSPTPSPLLNARSISPIAVRQVTKRRYTNSGSSEFDFDPYSLSATAAKRVCIVSRQSGCVSPLAVEPLTSTGIDLSALKWPVTGFTFPPSRLLIDPAIQDQPKLSASNDMDFQEFDKSKEKGQNMLNPVSPSTSAKDTAGMGGSSSYNDIASDKQA